MRSDLSEFQNPYERTTRDTWLLFKIFSEFVEGFDLLKPVDPAVSVFGSARLDKTSKYFRLAEKTCETITSSGFSLISGGGPGIMEAANKGANKGIKQYKRSFPKERPPVNVGLTIQLPFEPKANPYVDLEVNFRYFFIRKVMFAKYARAFVILPGGFGTMDELFEALTLIQTEKMEAFPIVMIGKDYWKGLVDWMQNTQVKLGALTQKNLELITLTDDPDEAVDVICQHYEDLVSIDRTRKQKKKKKSRKRKPKTERRG